MKAVCNFREKFSHSLFGVYFALFYANCEDANSTMFSMPVDCVVPNNTAWVWVETGIYTYSDQPSHSKPPKTICPCDKGAVYFFESAVMDEKFKRTNGDEWWAEYLNTPKLAYDSYQDGYSLFGANLSQSCSDFCFCDHTGTCLKPIEFPSSDVDIIPFCDVGGCFMYAAIWEAPYYTKYPIGYNYENGTKFTAVDVEHIRMGSDSPYIKVMAMGCHGCGPLKQIKCDISKKYPIPPVFVMGNVIEKFGSKNKNLPVPSMDYYCSFGNFYHWDPIDFNETMAHQYGSGFCTNEKVFTMQEYCNNTDGQCECLDACICTEDNKCYTPKYGDPFSAQFISYYNCHMYAYLGSLYEGEEEELAPILGHGNFYDEMNEPIPKPNPCLYFMNTCSPFIKVKALGCNGCKNLRATYEICTNGIKEYPQASILARDCSTYIQDEENVSCFFYARGLIKNVKVYQNPFYCFLFKISIIFDGTHIDLICLTLVILLILISIFSNIKDHYRWFILNHAVFATFFIIFAIVKDRYKLELDEFGYKLDRDAYKTYYNSLKWFNYLFLGFIRTLESSFYFTILLFSFNRFMGMFYPHVYLYVFRDANNRLIPFLIGCDFLFVVCFSGLSAWLHYADFTKLFSRYDEIYNEYWNSSDWFTPYFGRLPHQLERHFCWKIAQANIAPYQSIYSYILLAFIIISVGFTLSLIALVLFRIRSQIKLGQFNHNKRELLVSVRVAFTIFVQSFPLIFFICLQIIEIFDNSPCHINVDELYSLYLNNKIDLFNGGVRSTSFEYNNVTIGTTENSTIYAENNFYSLFNKKLFYDFNYRGVYYNLILFSILVDSLVVLVFLTHYRMASIDFIKKLYTFIRKSSIKQGVFHFFISDAKSTIPNSVDKSVKLAEKFINVKNKMAIPSTTTTRSHV